MAEKSDRSTGALNGHQALDRDRKYPIRGPGLNRQIIDRCFSLSVHAPHDPALQITDHQHKRTQD
jgi:hypothetical protein